ncbi:MAG: hypothetical protein NTX50_12785 [Candidatus Sumerlaeota bacterium]|nr:hypothetical protein [Candidatus Sumerlaeota bacterium]
MRTYGDDYRNVSIAVTPDEHKRYKMLAAQYEVSMSDVARLSLNDERKWKEAAKSKAQTRGKKKNS